MASAFYAFLQVALASRKSQPLYKRLDSAGQGVDTHDSWQIVGLALGLSSWLQVGKGKGERPQRRSQNVGSKTHKKFKLATGENIDGKDSSKAFSNSGNWSMLQ